jgi:alcohol dehydrogenase/L-iditol 2-dehydrogenase
MKALVKYDLVPDAVRVDEIEEPALTPGYVLIDVQAAGVCGSDIHLWKNGQSWPVDLPLVLGHETVGIISAVSPEISGWSVGERVVCETAAVICGNCAYCQSGRYNLCPSRLGYGAKVNGSFTARIVAEPRVLHRVPDSVTDVAAALTEPLCVALNALAERAKLKPADRVVVQGAGAIGLLCVVVSRLCGVQRVILLGTKADQHRFEIGRQFGADVCIDVDTAATSTMLDAIGGDGFGADVVVDATGVSSSFAQAMELVRPAGSLVKVGWGPQPAGYSLDPLVAKAVTVYGSFSHTWSTWERALALIATGQVNTAALVGVRNRLEDWLDAFTAMHTGRVAKSVLLPSVS